MEKPLYINYEDKYLFSVLHTPENTNSKKGIIFLHPYAEEKQRVDRVLVRFARLLCGKGYFVMRFDFHGCGDSEGNFEELTFESQLSDLRRVLDTFKRDTGVEEISLLGVRLGASIAVQYAEIDHNIKNLILWSPVISGAEYLGILLRNKMFSQLMEDKIKVTKEMILDTIDLKGKIDIDGFYLTKKYHDYLNNLDFLSDVPKFDAKVFIGITKPEALMKSKYAIFTEVLHNNGNRCDFFITEDKGYWDQRTHYEWYIPHNLIKQTLDWITDL